VFGAEDRRGEDGEGRDGAALRAGQGLVICDGGGDSEWRSGHVLVDVK
jgi:hypothetical protein